MARLLVQQRAPLQRRRYRAAVLVLAAFAASWLVAFDHPLARAETATGQEFLLIVNQNNPITEVTSAFAAEAFLKKTTRWGDGESIRPVDLAPDSAIRRRFSARVLKRSVAAVRSYWQQRIFTGRDVPPPELDSDESVVHYVLKYPGAIGYVAPNTKIAGTKLLTLRAK
jgi:ABC-type phosphate transport system substrate-binding protein